MKSLEDLYSSIKDPLDDDKTIDRIIKEFIKKDFQTDKLRDAIQEEHDSDSDQPESDAEEKYRQWRMDMYLFHKKMIDKWKERVLSLSEEEIEHLKEKKKINEDFIKLKKCLEQSTPAETEQSIYSRIAKEIGGDALDANRWYQWQGGYKHIKSRNMSGRREDPIQIKHRLFMNVGGSDTFKIVGDFIERCEALEIPYYLKYAEIRKIARSDKIVIFSDDDHIMQYIGICKELKEAHPEVKFGKAPILTGKITEWLGFGSEPMKVNEGKRTTDERESYTSIRCKAIGEALSEVYNDLVEAGFSDEEIKQKGQMFLAGAYHDPKLAIDTVRAHIRDNCEKYGIDRNAFFLEDGFRQVVSVDDVLALLEIYSRMTRSDTERGEGNSEIIP